MPKTNYRNLYSICHFFLLSTIALSAQSQFAIKDILDKNAGLTQRPLCMLEDREGFFWIGTEKGLFRFDGSRAREVRLAPEDSLTDLSRNIFTLLLDQTEELLWIGTGDGIFKYQLHSGKSEKLAAAAFFRKGDYKIPLCRVLFQDRQGELWANFAVPGLVHLQDKGQSTEQFTCTISPEEDAEGMGWDQANAILCMVQDPVQDSIIWAGTRAGLIKFNKETRTIRHYYFSHPERNMRPKANAMLALFAQADRKLYIGTYNGGLLVFNPNTEHFEQYLVQPEVDLEKTRKNGVTRILAHSPEELWISQPDKLFLFNTQSKQFTKIRGANGLDFIDRAGNYWDRVEAGLELFHHTKNQIQYLPFPDE